MSTLIKYWPAIVAGLYLAYVVAAGQTGSLGAAIERVPDRRRPVGRRLVGASKDRAAPVTFAPGVRPAVSAAERCARCPVDDARCIGLDVRRYCELLDPACAKHDAQYAGVVLAESRRIAEAPALGAIALGMAAAYRSCCGGVATYPE